MAAIISRSQPDVRFQLAGTRDEAAVRRLAQECGVQDRLDLLGRVSDVPSFLSTLDVAVLTSHSEGLSNALLEYMAAGRPIVATAVGGNVELIEDGVHGLFVRPGDPAAVAAAIDRLLRDPVLAARLAAAAKRRAMEEYSLESSVGRVAAFYSRLLRNGAEPVAAGAVVRGIVEPIPPRSVAAGNPATVKKSRAPRAPSPERLSEAAM